MTQPHQRHTGKRTRSGDWSEFVGSQGGSIWDTRPAVMTLWCRPMCPDIIEERFQAWRRAPREGTLISAGYAQVPSRDRGKSGRWQLIPRQDELAIGEFESMIVVDHAGLHTGVAPPRAQPAVGPPLPVIEQIVGNVLLEAYD